MKVTGQVINSYDSITCCQQRNIQEVLSGCKNANIRVRKYYPFDDEAYDTLRIDIANVKSVVNGGMMSKIARPKRVVQKRENSSNCSIVLNTVLSMQGRIIYWRILHCLTPNVPILSNET